MKIVGCIVEETVTAALQAMTQAAPLADMFELRLDHIRGLDRAGLAKLLSDPPRPCLVTNRPSSEGGCFSGGETDRLDLLKQALAFSPALIDLELASGREVINQFQSLKGRTGLLVSYHNFHRTPNMNELSDLLTRMNQAQAGVAKIVTRVETPAEAVRLKDLLTRARALNQPLAAFGLGSLSRFTRALAPAWGSALSYCSLGQGREAAPGQMSLKEMRRHFPGYAALPLVTNKTGLYGILGTPVGHSLSPVMHNAAFRHLGLDSFYTLLDIEDARLGLETARAFNFRGLSVTSPHKIAVRPWLDKIEPEAADLGAVNTIVNRSGACIGTNTDWVGVVKALEERIAPAGKKAVVAGAGGAARAAVYGLTRVGAVTGITNRTESRGRALALELGVEFIPGSELNQLNADILINATPLGQGSNVDETPFPEEMLRPGQVVLDMVYDPPVTRLLREAEKQGCVAIPGLKMLLHQAFRQFEIWTGQPAPVEIMTDAVRQAVEVNI